MTIYGHISKKDLRFIDGRPVLPCPNPDCSIEGRCCVCEHTGWVDANLVTVLPESFPILNGGELLPAQFPFWWIEPFNAQAEDNHGGQSLVRLAQRGGLSPAEIMAVVENRPWRQMSKDEAVQQLRAWLKTKTDAELLADTIENPTL